MQSSKKNFKFIIEYLGTHYRGWQFQPNCQTIQGEIENALKKILHKDIQTTNSQRKVSSSRTSIIGILMEVPTVMKHVFGHPLISKIL